MSPVNVIAHRAHYLQVRGEWSSSRGDREMKYYTSCDCGWLGEIRSNPRIAAGDYQLHMRVTPSICQECGK